MKLPLDWRIVLLVIGTLSLGLLVGFCVHTDARVEAARLPERSGVPTPAQTVKTLPEETSSGIVTRQDLSVFDLRYATATQVGGAMVTGTSYLNLLRVSKTSGVDAIVAHYSTSGERIEFACVTHSCKVFQEAMPVHPGEHTYALQIDVSREPLGREFLILVQATYWGGFRLSETQQSAYTYTDSDTSRLSDLRLVVLLPESKPAKGWGLWVQGDSAGAEWKRYEETADLSVDPGGRYFQWQIRHLNPSSHYRFDWTW